MSTNQKTLYEILGVEKDAPFEDIKRAYRNLAQVHHPDKQGGTNEEFAKISNAYRILKDPGSRLLYDNTGKTEQLPIEKEIENILLAAFTDALKSGAKQTVEHARKFVEGGKKQMTAHKIQLLELQRNLLQKKNKVTVKKGRNLFDMIVDKELSNVTLQLNETNRQLDIIEKCFEALESYISLEPPPPPPPKFQSEHDSFTYFTGFEGPPDYQANLKERLEEFKRRRVKEQDE